MPYVSIVIPAFNEENNLRLNLPKIEKFVKKFEKSCEVIIVDDGSSDKTAAIVLEFIKNKKNFRLIRNPHKGKGFSIRTGVQDAEGDLIYLADADLATPIDDIGRFVFWIEEHGFDIVIGSREGLGAKRIGEPFYRHLMGRVFNLIIRVILGLKFRDTQCGFKLFKRNVAKELFGMQKLYGEDTSIVRGTKLSAYDVEILFLACKKGYKIKELPVTWEFGIDSKVDPIRDSWINFLDVVKVKMNDLRGEYKV